MGFSDVFRPQHCRSFNFALLFAAIFTISLTSCSIDNPKTPNQGPQDQPQPQVKSSGSLTFSGKTTLNEGQSEKISVTYENPNGERRIFQLKEISAQSSDPSILEITEEGVKAILVGEAKVTVSLKDPVTDKEIEKSATFKILPAKLLSLHIEVQDENIPLGHTSPIKVVGNYTNGTTEITSGVAWSIGVNSKGSESKEEANIKIESGLVKTLKVGTTFVSAQLTNDPEITSDRIQVNVTNAVLEEIFFKTPKSEIPAGLKESFVVLGRFSDGSEKEVTSRAHVSSTNHIVAERVYPGDEIKAKAIGNTQLTAIIYQGSKALQALKEIIVTRAKILSISSNISGTLTLPVGVSKEIEFKANLSDGSRRRVKECKDPDPDNSWFISYSKETGEIKGKVKGKGEVPFVCLFDSIEFTTTIVLEVTDPVPVKMEIPKYSLDSENEIPVGIIREVNPVVTFSDGSIQNLLPKDFTLEVYSRDKSDIRVISNSFHYLRKGWPRVLRVQFRDLDAFIRISSVDPVITKISLSSDKTRVPIGYRSQFRVKITLSDNESVTRDITKSMTYNGQRLSIIELPDSDGKLTDAFRFKGPTGLIANESGGATFVAKLALGEAPLVSNEVVMTAIPPVLEELKIETASGSGWMRELPVGTEMKFLAFAYFSDGSKIDMSQEVSWIFDGPSDAYSFIDNTFKALDNTVSGENSLFIGVKAKANTPAGEIESNIIRAHVTAAKLVRLENLGSETLYLSPYSSYGIKVSGIYTDQSVHDMTSKVQFETDCPALDSSIRFHRGILEMGEFPDRLDGATCIIEGRYKRTVLSPISVTLRKVKLIGVNIRTSESATEEVCEDPVVVPQGVSARAYLDLIYEVYAGPGGSPETLSSLGVEDYGLKRYLAKAADCKVNYGDSPSNTKSIEGSNISTSFSEQGLYPVKINCRGVSAAYQVQVVAPAVESSEITLFFRENAWRDILDRNYEAYLNDTASIYARLRVQFTDFSLKHEVEVANVIWESHPEGIVEIDSKGEINPISVGTTQISAKFFRFSTQEWEVSTPVPFTVLEKKVPNQTEVDAYIAKWKSFKDAIDPRQATRIPDYFFEKTQELTYEEEEICQQKLIVTEQRGNNDDRSEEVSVVTFNLADIEPFKFYAGADWHWEGCGRSKGSCDKMLESLRRKPTIKVTQLEDSDSSSNLKSAVRIDFITGTSNIGLQILVNPLIRFCREFKTKK
jgi:hypothetical protein